MAGCIWKFFTGRGDLKLSSERLLILFLVSLVFVDALIVVQIPLLSPICGFLYFLTVPGFVSARALKLTKIEPLEMCVIAFGLSLSFLIFGGLFFDVVYSAIGITNPISVAYMVPSLSFALLLLTIVDYSVNRGDEGVVTIPTLRSVLKVEDKLPLLIFPSLFPFMAVIGTYLMNTQGNNSVLIALLLLIPSYVVALVLLQQTRNIAQVVFPATVLMISIALLLSLGLTSNYIIGSDVHSEYLAYQQVINSHLWSFSAGNLFSVTVSTSLLPAVLQLLTGVQGVYMFKLVLQLIGAVTPLVVYIISRKYLRETYALFASFLFMAQLWFVADMVTEVREEIALLFFALAVMIFFANDLKHSRKTPLFLLFATEAILAHYTTGLILIFMLLISSGMAAVLAGYYRFKRRHDAQKSAGAATAIGTAVLLFAIFFLWYIQLAQTNNVTVFGTNIIHQLSNLFVADSRTPGILHAVGTGITTLPQSIRAYTYDLLYIIIGVGALAILSKRRMKPYTDRYAFLIIASVGLVIVWFVVPYLSDYSILRLFQQLLVLLVVPFFAGVFVILRSMKITRERYVLSVVIMILLLQYACSSLLLDQAFGIPSSITLNRAGESYNDYYTYPAELVGAQWLQRNMDPAFNITADYGGGMRLWQVGFDPQNITGFLSNRPQANSYYYLDYTNVQGEFLNATIGSAGFATQYGYSSSLQYSQQYSTKSKIYDNGYSTIYG
ncbi:MAG: DUF2206 domain-containing protein [Halobacteriota archaeon]